MSILINKSSRVITQGITGKTGQFHTRACRDYANGKACFVAGVNPKKAGENFEGVPIYATVKDAKAATGANVSVVYVPPAGAAEAISEAVDADLDLVICITEGIPVKDMIVVRDRMRKHHKKTLLLGPNCPGAITPDEIKIGIMPGHIHRKGRIGVVSRSGTLTYEAVAQLTDLGLGQSSAVGIGGVPVNGLKQIDILKLFNEDPETDAVVMIGEIGGTDEEIAAEWVQKHMTKPVVGFIAGVTAPPGKRIGHAGAIISGGKGTPQEKLAVMEACGIRTTKNPSELGKLLKSVLSKILIVEDDLDIAELLNAYFRVQGYEVFTVNWGEDGVRAAQTVLPDLMILDIRLPDIDGYEVARRVRTDRRTNEIPIIFLTEKRERVDRLQGFEVGADDYITKPFDVQELRLRVRNALKRVSQGSLTNPVSGLAEGALVDERLSDVIHKSGWALLHISISHLDSFREAYGFVASDDVLRAISLMIHNTMKETSSPEDFLGHILGGDHSIALPLLLAVATNTSSYTLVDIAAKAVHPERCVGLHFFNPVAKMQLVEVVRAPFTSDSALKQASSLAKRLGKFPLVVNDGPGFLVNRILSRYLAEAVILVGEGVPFARMDRVAKTFGMAVDSGHPMGPLELLDLIGLSVGLHVLTSLTVLGPRIESREALLRTLLPEKGPPITFCKSGKENPQALNAVAMYRQAHPSEAGVLSDDVIHDRLILPMVDEAVRRLHDKIVEDPWQVDFALTYGIGFPAFRGGLLGWAGRSMGHEEIREKLESLSKSYGKRFEPSPELSDRSWCAARAA